MRYRFLTCDVFTDTRFGGNPLAVLPDARGLDGEQMQQIAREFNYSETTFVLPAQNGHDRRVRIYTPVREVPFAGHPNIGTAFVLATIGELGPADVPRTVVFEEPAGLVPVAIRPSGEGRIWCELTAPERFRAGPPLPVEGVAAALGLTPSAIVTGRHLPLVGSVGLPFVIVELADLDALASAEPDVAALGRLGAQAAGMIGIHAYVRVGSLDSGASVGATGRQPPVAGREDPQPGGAESEVAGLEQGRPSVLGPDDIDLRARMFAPLTGVAEDPATGSANCALAGLLASLEPTDGQRSWRIAQGVEMGRPSLLHARAERRGGQVTGVWVGGESVLVCDGHIEV